MDLGIHVPSFTWPGAPGSIAGTLRAIGEAAEDVGATHLTVMDHFFQLEMLGPPEMEMLEGYSTLAYLAACTEKVHLSMLVTGITYRHPGLLAKIVTTLDVLSGGRAQLGIGAAWFEREHKGLGVPFPALKERYERLEETLQICLQMWSDNNGPYAGKHYQLAETINSPAPIQSPRPPILIGGVGEKKTLRLVAKYADACNLFSAVGVDGAKHKLEVLKKHCENEGTDYDRIKRTILWVDAWNDVDAWLEQMKQFAAVGIQEVYVMPVAEDPVAMIRSLKPVAPALREL